MDPSLGAGGAGASFRPTFKPTTSIEKQKDDHTGQITMTQTVKFNDKEYKVTLMIGADKEGEAEDLMGATVEKMVALAIAFKLGQGKTQSISLSGDKVTKVKSDGTTKEVDLQAKLTKWQPLIAQEGYATRFQHLSFYLKPAEEKEEEEALAKASITSTEPVVPPPATKPPSPSPTGKANSSRSSSDSADEGLSGSESS